MLGHDRGHVAQHPAALEHDRADREMGDRGFRQHEARIVGQQRDAAEQDHQRQARPGHEAERLALDPRVDDLADRAGDRDRRRQHHVLGGEVDDQKDDGGQEIGGELANTAFILASSVWIVRLDVAYSRPHLRSEGGPRGPYSG